MPRMNPDTDPRLDLARNLFAAWSSGDADAPEQYLTPDAVLYDIVGGEHRGWPAIRAFFAAGCGCGPISCSSPSSSGRATTVSH